MRKLPFLRFGQFEGQKNNRNIASHTGNKYVLFVRGQKEDWARSYILQRVDHPCPRPQNVTRGLCPSTTDVRIQAARPSSQELGLLFILLPSSLLFSFFFFSFIPLLPAPVGSLLIVTLVCHLGLLLSSIYISFFIKS